MGEIYGSCLAQYISGKAGAVHTLIGVHTAGLVTACLLYTSISSSSMILYACNTSERDILIARKNGQRAVRGKPRPPPSIMRKGKSLDWLPTHRILMPRPAATSLKDAMVSSKCFWASSTVRYMAVPPIFSTASQ